MTKIKDIFARALDTVAQESTQEKPATLNVIVKRDARGNVITKKLYMPINITTLAHNNKVTVAMIDDLEILIPLIIGAQLQMLVLQDIETNGVIDHVLVEKAVKILYQLKTFAEEVSKKNREIYEPFLNFLDIYLHNVDEILNAFYLHKVLTID